MIQGYLFVALYNFIYYYNKRSDTKKEVNDTPNKNLVTGKDFVKLTKKALCLGSQSLDYSKRKNNKYFVTLENGKKVYFGSAKYKDYLIHGDEDR